MRDAPQLTFQLPRPGRVLKAVMLGLLSIWVMLAVAINYGGMPFEAFLALTGNTEAILRGEVWRLFTAPLVHLPSGPGAVSHIGFALLGFYFLAPILEARWGGRRTIFFLAGSALIGFVTQLVGELVFPRLGQSHWFGSYGVIEAIAVAWALSNRGQQVRLFFILPVSARGLLFFVIGMSILRVIGAAHPYEGLITPFGGMLAGWLLGGGSPSPLRKLWLKLRYASMQRRAARYQSARKARTSRAGLRIIEGGNKKRKDDSYLN